MKSRPRLHWPSVQINGTTLDHTEELLNKCLLFVVVPPNQT